MIVKGTVQQVIERPTKFGSYWDIVVEGRKYGTGKKRPPCFDGDVVEFSAEAKGDFFNADPTSFTKLAAAPVVPAAGKAASSVAPAKTWVPEKDRQDTISYQAARNAAIDFTRLALEAGKIDFGKMKGAEAMELLETYVDNYTERFFDDTKNLGHKKTKKAATSEAEPFNDSVEDI